MKFYSWVEMEILLVTHEGVADAEEERERGAQEGICHYYWLLLSCDY